LKLLKLSAGLFRCAMDLYWNFFVNRSTNAAAESFNAKIKAFRAASSDVRDTTFFFHHDP
jgi:hypothetical protein